MPAGGLGSRWELGCNPGTAVAHRCSQRLGLRGQTPGGGGGTRGRGGEGEDGELHQETGLSNQTRVIPQILLVLKHVSRGDYEQPHITSSNNAVTVEQTASSASTLDSICLLVRQTRNILLLH